MNVLNITMKIIIPGWALSYITIDGFQNVMQNIINESSTGITDIQNILSKV